MDCYAAEFETLTVDETGVPLEHLVTWVPNVELAVNLGCVKYLRTVESKPSQPEKVEGRQNSCLVFKMISILVMERIIFMDEVVVRPYKLCDLSRSRECGSHFIH